MSGPQIVVEMDSDEAKLWAGFQRIMRGEEGMEKGMGKVAGETRKAAAEQAALERAAKRVIDSVMTPQERYNAKIAELNRLYGASKLSVDQFRAATQRAGSQLDATGQAGEKAFGAAAVASVGRYVGGLASIATVLGIATRAMREMDAAREEAFERAKGERAGLAELAGLAKTPEEAQGYITEARKAYASGVGGSEDEAAGLHYALVSAGLYEDRKLFEDLSRSGVIRDVKPAVGATKTLQYLMGEKETGDATAVMSKLYQAADVTQYEVQDVARAVATPALYAAKLGMSDEDLIAQGTAGMMGMPVSKVDSAARAYYQALLLHGGFEGLSASEQIEKVKETVGSMSAEDQKKWFGSVEAQDLYGILAGEQGQKVVQEQLVALPEAERTQLALRKATLPDVDTGLRRTKAAEVAKRQSDAEDRPEGMDRALAEAIIEEHVAALKQRGGNFEAWAAGAMMRIPLPGRDERVITGASAFQDDLSPGTQAELKEWWRLRRLEENDPAEIARRLHGQETEAAPPMSPAGQRQIDELDAGRATVTQVVPTPTGNDPQMSENNQLARETVQTLKEIRDEVRRSPQRPARPLPASSSAANNQHRE